MKIGVLLRKYLSDSLSYSQRRFSNNRHIAKIRRFRWWNVFDDMIV